MVKTKKGVTAASISHPNSRKAIQLTKQVKKIENRKKAKNFHLMKQNMEGIKFTWFRDHLDPNINECTRDMLAGLIEQYLSRFNEELQQIKLKNSIGQRKKNQHASREAIIMLTKLQERQEYNNAGIELPDILNKKQLSMLCTWNGELRFLQNFKMRRFNKGYLTSKSNLTRPPSPVEMQEEHNMEHDTINHEEKSIDGDKLSIDNPEDIKNDSNRLSNDEQIEVDEKVL